MRDWEGVTKITHIAMLVCALLIILLLLCLSGCESMSSSSGSTKLIWHNGQCLLVVDGLTATQADEIDDLWEFKECEVTIKGEND